MLAAGSGSALHGWSWWRSIGSPKTVCAPMVDQSERAFRMLCRGLNVDLCYTPMLHARLFTELDGYREQHFDAAPADEPLLIAQFAGHDPVTVLAAARLVEGKVSAMDLNFGCPQGIARKGRYGAFLLDEPDLMVELVRTLSRELSVPVTAKLRLLPSEADRRSPSHEASVALCQRLADAGASALAVHGRTREQNKQYCGRADWAAIRAVVRAVDIPVIANGGIGSAADAEACLAQTGAAAVMSSEALLENPALFCRNRDPTSGAYLDQDELASRYLDACEAHPPSKGAVMVRAHLFKFLHHGLKENPVLRDELLLARTLPEMRAVAARLADTRWTQPAFHTEHERAHLSWYARHRDDGDDARDRGNDAVAMPRGASAVDSAAGSSDAVPPLQPLSREEAAAAALAKRDRKAQDRRRRNRNRSQGTRSERGVSRASAFMAMS